VGDSEVDVLTAKNAGVPCLSVLWGFRDRPLIQEWGGSPFCEQAEDLAEKIEEIIHGKLILRPDGPDALYHPLGSDAQYLF
jgi:hypothetical protein